jgi:hypothetical protein
VDDEPESLTNIVFLCVGIIGVVGLLVWKPEWSMFIIFACALLAMLFWGTDIADPDDLLFAFKAIALGSAILWVLAVTWFFFIAEREVSLRDFLIPHKVTSHLASRMGFRLSLIGWVAIFVGLLQGCRVLFRAIVKL